MRPASRGNNLGYSEWNAAMDNLTTITSITSFNDIGGLAKLFKGGQINVDLGENQLSTNEAVVVVGRLLQRSGATLTKLDLRYHCIARWGDEAPAPEADEGR